MAPRDRRLVTAVTLPMLAAYGYRIGTGAAPEGRAPARPGAAEAAPSNAARYARRR
jgi:hypothetical protein